MPFSSFGLHPDLLRGVAELGFTRPTPIQEQAIPPALEGRDILACAMTGSGKTAAFVLPILHRLMGKPRGTTRALVLTPTRELAAQIEEHLDALAVHTPLSGAAVFGGVGMGPQEHAFRRGVDVIVATPGRLLDHFRYPYARLAASRSSSWTRPTACSTWASCPTSGACCGTCPPRRQTLFFSATMPAADRRPSRARCCKNPVTINLERKSAPAVGITQAVYPVRQELKSALLVELLQARRDPQRDRLHADQAPRQPPRRLPGAQRGHRRPHPRQPQPGAAHGGAGRLQGGQASRSWWPPTSRPAASTWRRCRTW